MYVIRFKVWIFLDVQCLQGEHSFFKCKRAGDATKIMQLWQKIPAKIVYLGFQLIGMEFSHSPSKGKETKKKREKLKKRKERKRNDKWKESKAKNKKKIAFCKCIRNDSEPSSRLVSKALSYGFVEKPENGFLTKSSALEMMTKLIRNLWT